MPEQTKACEDKMATPATPAPAGLDRTEPLSVTLQETMRLTGLSNTTLYKLINEKRLPTVKIGKRVLVPYASVKALVTPRTPGGAQ